NVFDSSRNGMFCQNSSKWLSLWTTAGNTNQWDSTDGANSPMLIYAWTGWTPSLDCCRFGPGFANQASIPALAASIVTGHWYRYEVILRNMVGNLPSNQGVRMEAYRQDVTQNTAQVKIIDTSVACTDCSPNDLWTAASGATTTLKTPGNA